MTIEEKARAYDEALEKGRIFRDHLLETGDKGIAGEIEYIFPALSQSEDEQIRKALIEMVHDTTGDELWVDYNVHKEEALAWLEKQCYTKKDVDDAYLKGIIDAKNELEKQGTPAKLSEEEQNRFAKVVLTSCALSFIDFLDAHKYEGKMCVSNGECEDIENAFHNAMWDRLHRYYCKYIEKQGEQKPFDYEHATITQKGFAPKPTAWSEEDENYLQSAENACEYQYGKNTSTILWLKSLKDRVRGKEDKHGNL